MSGSLFLYYCLAAAAALVYVPFVLVALGRLQVGYDYAAPRAMFDKLPPYAQRATWAHQNAFEGFALYTAAVLMVLVSGRNGEWANTLAVAYLAFRAGHGLFYIANLPWLRSGMWILAMTCIAGLMAIPLGVLG
ncbi:MAPEG family protein [Gloeobacter morelensis]|uniref:MAPEG family protein n=1 Tax=Gloeobacter morelensis MG652769 TaxID=2781736 RepID=A0ABY3PK61_9CYAN|nr:MAPEG family protein [Gloeobacter morelensis]UFP93969.1 MAPEG family protein [Gloeobacter morelensis MG652769]